MGNESQLYREKSMERLSEPEQLTDYLHVTGPGVWFLLSGILILLAGLFVWGIFGRITTTVTAPAQVQNGEVTCYMLAEDAEKATNPVEIAIGDLRMTADAETSETLVMNAASDPGLFASGYLSPGRNVVAYSCKTSLEDGFYDAVVTTETLRPISLLFSRKG